MFHAKHCTGLIQLISTFCSRRNWDTEPISRLDPDLQPKSIWLQISQCFHKNHPAWHTLSFFKIYLISSLDEHEGHLRVWMVYFSCISVCPCANKMQESPTYSRINKITKSLKSPQSYFFLSLKITCFAKYSETYFPFLNRFFFSLTHISYWDSQLITPTRNTPRLLVYSGKHLVNLENSLD